LDRWISLEDALVTGRREVRTLSIKDAYRQEMLAIEVDTLPALREVRVFDKLRQLCGKPVRIVIDNGTEFTSNQQQSMPAGREALAVSWPECCFQHDGDLAYQPRRIACLNASGQCSG